MTSNFRNVLGEALARLKEADVRGAAAAIQRSLGLTALAGPAGSHGIAAGHAAAGTAEALRRRAGQGAETRDRLHKPHLSFQRRIACL